jgi:hypothetical protein
MMEGRRAGSDEDMMVYLPARVICGMGGSCSCLGVSTPRGELVGLSSSLDA